MIKIYIKDGDSHEISLSWNSGELKLYNKKEIVLNHNLGLFIAKNRICNLAEKITVNERLDTDTVGGCENKVISRRGIIPEEMCIMYDPFNIYLIDSTTIRVKPNYIDEEHLYEIEITK